MVSESTNRRFVSSRLNTVYWLLLTVLLGLPLITPLLRWSAVACTHDGHLHYHRVAAMAHAWAEGIYLTRWLPDLAFGYGYPFFVYREAAPLYAVLLPFLAGLPLPAASNLFYAVSILLCGAFMFLWARDLFGPRAAVVSAVAYMAAPYVMVDALIRGNSPESLALPLFPFLLWVGRRWMLYGSVRSFIGGVLGLALLSFGHNISTFIFAPTLLVYLLAIVWARGSRGAEEQRSGGDKERRFSLSPLLPISPALIRVFSLIILGLGLAFFYTGGALLEMDQVTLEMSTTTRNNDWRFNFASLGEILAPVTPEDPLLVNPPLLFRLGWVPFLLAAVGLTGLVWIKGNDPRDRERRLHIWLMIIGAAAYLFMALPLSRWLWESLPLIDFVQFPWRFVGRAALPVAFLSGVPFYWFERTRDVTPDASRISSLTSRISTGWWPTILTAVAIALLIIEAIPNLYPRYCVEEPFPTIQTVHAYERITGLVGVDPEGSYFPRTVRERPSGSPLEADYGAGQTPQRFDGTALPATAEIQDIAYSRRGVTLTVTSPEPFTARYLSFAFPGWTARIDGERVPITPEDPSGLITFDVPAGTHEVSVEWGATPLRLALVALSALSAVGVVVVVYRERRRAHRLNTGQYMKSDRIYASYHGELIVLGFLAIALLLTKTLIIDRQKSFLMRSGAPSFSLYETLLSNRVQSSELRLEGVTSVVDDGIVRVRAGETFDINMAWKAIASPTADYQTEVWLELENGLIWSEKGTQRPRTYEDAPPTRLWSVGEWAWDSREVRVLPGTPPGTYDIVMTLFDKATLQPVTLTDADTGKIIGPTAVIGFVSVENPIDPKPPEVQFPLNVDVPGSGLRLIGYNQDRSESAPGDIILLTLFWECSEPTLCGRIRLQLRDETGALMEEWKMHAIREGFWTGDWPANGYLRAQHLLSLPRDLAGGRYQFTLNDDILLGELDVVAIDRQYEPPPLAKELNVHFSSAFDAAATLVGITAELPLSLCTLATPPDSSCSLPLVWRAEAETPVSYHVFIHLVDEAGNILAQSDAIPANWTRPTTGWLPGEYVTDVHTLSLPAELPTGPLSLRVGLYDPGTGQRLRTDGADFVSIEITQ